QNPDWQNCARPCPSAKSCSDSLPASIFKGGQEKLPVPCARTPALVVPFGDISFRSGSHIMVRFCLTASLAFCLLGGSGTQAQPERGSDKKEESIRKMQNLLDEQLIETGDLQTEMPLAAFLEALEKQLPQVKKVSLSIDKEAFGDKFAEVAKTGVRLPRSS